MQHIQTNSENELLLHLALSRITFLKFHEKIILSKKLDSLQSIVLLSIEEISNIIGRPVNSRALWNGEENLRMANIALHYCKTLGIKIILYNDKEYPQLLRQIEDPPYLLFCRGNSKALCSLNNVSVVGTRQLTQQGKEYTKEFTYEAVINGYTVISGLANGTDGFAHQGAIDAYYDCIEKGISVENIGRTIAVLPCAIDEIVPYSHKILAKKIIETGGCLISEYEPKMEMANWHFVGRNRIIAGLSPATVVMEAPSGSGALITADFALDYGRDLMFHKSAVSPEAKKIADSVKRKLEIEFAQGHKSRYKIENSAEKYINAGAPVIDSYKDYCQCISENPGMHKQTYIQGELFQ